MGGDQKNSVKEGEAVMQILVVTFPLIGASYDFRVFFLFLGQRRKHSGKWKFPL